MAGKPAYAKPRLGQGIRVPKTGGLPIKANMGISGIEETKRYLNKIPIDLRDKVLGKALKSAGEILRHAEIGTLGNSSGRKTIEIERSFGSGKRKRTRKVLERGILGKALRSSGAIITKKNWDKSPIVWVRAAKGKYARPYNAWYAHFYEFGTKFYKKKPQGYGYVLRAYSMVQARCVREIQRYVVQYFNTLR